MYANESRLFHCFAAAGDSAQHGRHRAVVCGDGRSDLMGPLGFALDDRYVAQAGLSSLKYNVPTSEGVEARIKARLEQIKTWKAELKRR